jgi:hypothetical protein
VAAIDDLLPVFDAHEVHSVALRLDPEEAVALALALPVACDVITRTLFRLRGLGTGGTIGEALPRLGLRELVRSEGEVVFGAVGTPWRPRGGLRPFADVSGGGVRVAADFRADGERLTTETRIAALDEPSRRAFLRYWRVVGPCSALIRRRWLAAVASRAAA